MTREEAIKRIQQDLDVHKKYLSKEYKEALNMAIEALSADGDLISRAEAIKAVEQEYRIDRGYMVDDYTYGFNQAIDYISDIVIAEVPSVSAERVGEWIFKDNDGGFAGQYHCGNCGKRAEVDLYGEWILSNYCPNCGARMDKERRAE